MKQWYVLKTFAGRETEAVELLERKVSHNLWNECRILKKEKVFRSGGILNLVEDMMFSGYVFVNTDCPDKLAKELKKAEKFPQPLVGNGEQDGNTKKNSRVIGMCEGQIYSERESAELEEMIPLEAEDLEFLKSICGENLQRPMGVSRIFLDSENQIIRADGVLASYLNQIVKLNLHKRFAIVEVMLFNRRQKVLFGLQLEQDLAG